MMPNRYFICQRWDEPIEIDIHNDEYLHRFAIIGYFAKGFKILEKNYDLNHQIICFAWSAEQKLPFLGDNVIVQLYDEEHCRIPSYVNKVRAVFKPFGMYPNYVYRTNPLRLVQIELAEYIRNLTLWIPNGWKWLLSKRVRKNCHLVPIGYNVPYSVQPVEFDSRQYITSFQGSVVSESVTQSKLRRFIGTPKKYCRTRMLKSLDKLKSIYGEQKIKIGLTNGYQESLAAGHQAYFTALENSKFCVSPRGTVHETGRVADGLRCGCIVIADLLPKQPFYQDSPIIQIDNWDKLDKIISSLLADPIKMQALSVASVKYWQDMLSENALAEIYAKGLNLK